ncbi:MAG: hypothetical protein QM660_13070 [Dysgonomonas sp.]
MKNQDILNVDFDYLNIIELDSVELYSVNGGSIGGGIAYHMGRMTGMAKAFVDGFLAAF